MYVSLDVDPRILFPRPNLRKRSEQMLICLALCFLLTDIEMDWVRVGRRLDEFSNRSC